jgi:hypothetical protein
MLMCIFHSAGLAQSLGNAGTLYGTVTDPSSARIPSADVSLTNEITRYEQHVLADSNGEFRFTNVPFNEYHLEVRVEGFEISHGHVSVRSAVPMRISVPMKLASFKVSIVVKAEAALVEETPLSHADIGRDVFDRIPQGTISSGLSDMITMGTPGVVADSNGFFHPLGDHAQAQFVIDGQPITDQQGNLFSNQLPTNVIQSMESIYGSTPAEFGDKTSLVVTAVTRSGLGQNKLSGSISTQYGSFGTTEQSATLGFGNRRWGNFAGINATRSGRFVDTPEFLPLHDVGNNQSVFDRVDFQPNRKNALHLNAFVVRSSFQIPNSYDQQASGQDQRQLVNSINIAPGWIHSFGSAATLTVNPFLRQDRITYHPSADPLSDQPATMSQTRRLTNIGVRSYVEYLHGRHQAKFGAQITHTLLTERFGLALTDPTFNPVCLTDDGNPVLDSRIIQASDCAAGGYSPNPELAPGLVPHDLTRGGSYFDFHRHANIKQQAAFFQDTVKYGNLTINGGLRFDRYDGLSKGTSWQPRVGFAYMLKPVSTVLRFSYSRSFETPQNENLILSSVTGAGGLASNMFNAYESIPLQPGRRNQFNAGFQQAIRHYLVVDGDYFWKYTRNAYDLDTLLNTAIVFPIQWAESKMDGFSARISLVPIKGLSAYTMLGHTRARIFGPELGGLIFDAPVNGTVGRIDHDQALQTTTHIQYQPPKNWPWVAFTWRYDSGIVSGGVPDLETALTLTANQQAAIGFYCGGNIASLTNRITSCDSPNWGAKQINIPPEGTQNDDTNPARVAGRHVLSLSMGIDNLFHTDRYRWGLRFTGQNLTNTKRMYNFLSTCSGTHWVSPRSLRAQLTFSF